MDGIKAVFLDIDNTIFDFTDCGKFAMHQAFDYYEMPWKDEYFPVFAELNESLWQRIEVGTLTREQLDATRWGLVFELLKINGPDGVEFEEKFKEYFTETCFFVKGADEVIDYLAGKYRLFLASNGRNAQQLHRLALCGRKNVIENVFVSERMGAPKPTKAFFDGAFAEIEGLKPCETVMIGDSLSADMAGSIEYGMKSIWYDRHGSGDTKGLSPDYVIRSMSEVKNIL